MDVQGKDQRQRNGGIIGENQLLGTERGLGRILIDHISRLQVAALHHHWGLSHPL